MKTQLFINGEFVEPASGQFFDVIDPGTEEVFASSASGSLEDVEKAVAAARQAFDCGPWPKMSAVERGQILRKVTTLIEQRLDDLSRLEVRDNGKTLAEATGDIEDAAFCFTYYAQMAEEMAAKPAQKLDVGDARFHCKVVHDPIGVVGAIVPWNYPLLMAVWKVAPALAAGCTVVLKPSELCPLSCVELAKIIQEAGMPKGVFNLITGYGGDAGAPLVEHPDVDKLAFTGSLATGSKIMQTAAKDVRTVTLELGGKSPFIIFDDCEIDKAVEWVMCGIFANQGQVCSATSRVLVHSGIYGAFLARLKQEAEKIQIGYGLDEGSQLGPIVSAGQYEKVSGFVERAKQSGIRLVSGGKRPAHLDKGYYLEPTVFADVPLDAEIWKEEIFGPVVCVRSFDTEEEAVIEANNSEYGLAAAVMSDDLSRCERVAEALRVGVVWINCSQPTFSQAPWGGYKKSGIGRELGTWGIMNYFEVKQITRFDHNESWGWYIK